MVLVPLSERGAIGYDASVDTAKSKRDSGKHNNLSRFEFPAAWIIVFFAISRL